MNFDIPSTSKSLYSTSPYPYSDNHPDGAAADAADRSNRDGFKTPYVNPCLMNIYSRDSVDQFFRDHVSSEILQKICEKYPAWCSAAAMSDPSDLDKDKDIPSLISIRHTFITLQRRYGFQRDNMLNIFDLFMSYLDSRASRMTKQRALRNLHADFIGGEHANYRKWYFACQLDIHDEVGFSKVDKHGALTPEFKKKLRNVDGSSTIANSYDYTPDTAFRRWRQQMSALSDESRVAQIVLYLLCWGEANQLRFMPEFLNFIFKCLYDNYVDETYKTVEAKEGDYLDSIITPIYQYYKDQLYETVDGKTTLRDKDHKDTIGYDDMNQLFWYRQGLLRLRTHEGKHILNSSKEQRYFLLKDINWSNAFYKSYRERRTWLHLLVNFNRIWIIHLGMFWFYTAYNSSSLYTFNYQYTIDNVPPLHIWCTIVAVGGGAIGPLINIICLITEHSIFVSSLWPGSQRFWLKLLFMFLLLAINVGPTIWLLNFTSNVDEDKNGTVVAIIQLVLSIMSWMYFSVEPLHDVIPFFSFNTKKAKRDRNLLANLFFTSSFPKMSESDRWISFSLWFCVYVAKFAESYFLLTLSVRDPIRELSILELSCVDDEGLSTLLCQIQPLMLLSVIIMTDLVLFFLDTYLWYVIFNTIFSVVRLFYLRSSIWPWRDIYSQLTSRIFYKLLNTGNAVPLEYRGFMTARVWNPIVYSLYRDHFIPRELLSKLLFLPEIRIEGQNYSAARSVSNCSLPGMLDPTFCGAPDQIFHSSALDIQSEAERRISFFAQSLAIPLPETVPINRMPSFTVLIPHYTEKIILSVKEIIRVADSHSQISLLEYLQRLMPIDWKCFVEFVSVFEESEDQSILSAPRVSLDQFAERTPNERISVPQNPRKFTEPQDVPYGASIDDTNQLPLYCIGFKNSSPMDQLQTRIWASLRTQTLLRTIYGFMKYSDAIDILEQAQLVPSDAGNESACKGSILPDRALSTRKFRFILAAQRLIKFDEQEKQDIDFIMRAFPTINVAYIDEEVTPEGEVVYYSALIDGDCPLQNDGMRKPKYRVRLSGNPVLGDGKSDNQNSALIFHRGEYIQLVDANQDNYLEECLKIRNILAEFEEIGQFESINRDPYGHVKEPVAIVGAREYIFSENIGVLGDIAAGKEQTFGTLFARTLAKIGGKLHYGHPDFLNGIFMITRGGVSKAQRGLHLNEDIYAGMNALIRGGRIKHSEYIQCGKGRDLGFASISNFTTKIGTGMGEQMLSREYYYLGTQLPIDRFLSFYYAHPGFHINNLFIIISLEMLLLTLLNLAMMFKRAPIVCEYNRDTPTTDPHQPIGCQNLLPLVEWVQRCVLSVMVVFSISFLPLFVQELTERGIRKSLIRLTKHLGSFSPLFEIFVCQIYAKSLIYNLSYGGAKYISTGRGFATKRLPFTVLYSKFAPQSIYFGARSILILVIVSSTIWRASLLWFWLTSVALFLAPFLFNPHQFSKTEFLLDYRLFFRWFNRGNTKWHNDSWIAYIKENRAKITGYKRWKGKDHLVSEEQLKGTIRPGFWNTFSCEVGSTLCNLMITLMAIGPGVLFEEDDTGSVIYTNPFVTLLVVSLGPIVANMAVLLVMLTVSLLIGPLVACISRRPKENSANPGLFKNKSKVDIFSSTVAQSAHMAGVVMHFVFYYVTWIYQKWNFQASLTMFWSAMMLESLIFKAIYVVVLCREPNHNRVNKAWWSGTWLSSKLEWSLLTQPFREFLCKVIEMSLFARDFVLGHCIFFLQVPFLFIPYTDRWHSMVLFWLLPSRQLRPPVLSRGERVQRKGAIFLYSCVLLIMFFLIVGLIVLPCILPEDIKLMTTELLEPYLEIPHSLLP